MGQTAFQYESVIDLGLDLFAVGQGAGTSLTGKTAAEVRTILDVLTSVQIAATYAPLASPALTGVPTAPTAGAGTNTTQIATTAFVTTAAGAYLPLTGGILTGTLRLKNGATPQIFEIYNREDTPTSFEAYRFQTLTGAATRLGQAVGLTGGSFRGQERGRWDAAGDFVAFEIVSTTGAVTMMTQWTNSVSTITTSQPHTLLQTWNNAAVPFTGQLSNITDTASAAGSLLRDSQVGGVSKHALRKDGVGSFVGLVLGGLSNYEVANANWWSSSALNLADTARLSFGNDTILLRDAANVLAQRNSTTAQRQRMYETYTSSTVFACMDIFASGTAFEISNFLGSGGGSVRPINIGSRNAAGTFTGILYVDTVNARVGVLTGSPGRAFDVNGAVTLGGSGVSAGSDVLRVFKGGSSQVLINPDNSGYCTVQVSSSNAARNSGFDFTNSADGVTWGIGNESNSTANTLIFANVSSGTAGFAAAARMSLTTAGLLTLLAGGAFGGPVSLGVYTFGTVPAAGANTGATIRISDRAQRQAYSDGTNWRFVADDVIIA